MSDIKIGKPTKVICTKNYNKTDNIIAKEIVLKKGQVYNYSKTFKVSFDKISETLFYIEDINYWVNSNYFLTVNEWREQQLNKLL